MVFHYFNSFRNRHWHLKRTGWAVIVHITLDLKVITNMSWKDVGVLILGGGRVTSSTLFVLIGSTLWAVNGLNDQSSECQYSKMLLSGLQQSCIKT